MTWIQFSFFSKVCRSAAFWKKRDPGTFFVLGWKAARAAMKEKKKDKKLPKPAKQLSFFDPPINGGLGNEDS